MNKESANNISHQIREVERGAFQEQKLHDNASSFTDKQPVYLSGFERFIRSKNASYVLECKGISS